MTSTKTQLPYDYYDIAVDCKPLNGTQYESENLGKEKSLGRKKVKEVFFSSGEILGGDRIINTNFKVIRERNRSNFYVNESDIGQVQVH